MNTKCKKLFLIIDLIIVILVVVGIFLCNVNIANASTQDENLDNEDVACWAKSSGQHYLYVTDLGDENSSYVVPQEIELVDYLKEYYNAISEESDYSFYMSFDWQDSFYGIMNVPMEGSQYEVLLITFHVFGFIQSEQEINEFDDYETFAINYVKTDGEGDFASNYDGYPTYVNGQKVNMLELNSEEPKESASFFGNSRIMVFGDSEQTSYVDLNNNELANSDNVDDDTTVTLSSGLIVILVLFSALCIVFVAVIFIRIWKKHKRRENK